MDKVIQHSDALRSIGGRDKIIYRRLIRRLIGRVNCLFIVC